MFSSPPTDRPFARAARWRSPAGWSLRARLVALMIALLAVLGLIVGATSEIYLHNTLYSQVDTRLDEASNRAFGHGGPNGAFIFVQEPPPGAQSGSVYLWLTGSSTGDPVVVGGGIVQYQPDAEDGAGRDADGGGFKPRNTFQQLPADVTAALSSVTPGTGNTDLDLGNDLGDYRVTAVARDGVVLVSALSLADTQATLLKVTSVTGVAVLLALVVAGWAGAVIVRRNLRPLERVAGTATRVSELRLDRGEVDLAAQRVPPEDTDARTEVGQVGAALNRMLDHVGNALEARHNSEMQVRQFVADASHELRTPLAAIRGYAELSRRSRRPVPDEVSHVLRRVESEAQRMTTLVEDLLLLARLDAGRPLAHDPVDLSMLVVDTVSDAHAAGPGHDWQLDLPEEPVLVRGDQLRLHQVLANLLANARTHTPEGTTVTVGVALSGRDALLRVTDTGPGIPPALQPHIFERFARGDSSRSRVAGSTGLGLSIVSAVVAAHGGTVWVDSRPGRTEFTVRLPLAPADGQAPPTSQPEADAVHQHVAQIVQ
ncbi:sensor histidine kinase [Mangrovihabitans endophyticus]|uniref:histidine kinase n=1 Tax=Mangrovihabitans endophyticus TaxID=1751298 RepID=A0A8J3FPX4_9ACTN|nr:HAMP domain-containing sensor histidine kinase [Mangrovihabitans endophyticus]GGK96133.1 two-component sensor histidine kinase [Mangrovihabitans endophyticus]